MKKIYISFCVMMLCMWRLYAGTPPKNLAPVARWEEPDARYRLECEPIPEMTASSVDLGRLALPGGHYERYEAFARGRRLRSRLDADHILHVEHPADIGEFRIYFGMKPKLGERVPEPERTATAAAAPPYLHLRMISGWVALTPQDYRARRTEQINRSMLRRYEYQNRASGQRFFELTTAPGFFGRFRDEAWLVNARANAAKMLRDKRALAHSRAVKPKRARWVFPRFYHNTDFRMAHFLRRYLRDRLLWQLPGTAGNPGLWRKQLDEMERLAPNAPRTELERLLNNPRRRIAADVFVRRLMLDKRPFDTGGNFVAEFSGQLAVREKQTVYEFAFCVNSTSYLEIDGKTVWRRFGEAPAAGENGDQFKTTLSRGLHTFRFFYVKRQVTTGMHVALRRSDGVFRVLTRDDFAPGGAPAEPVGLRGRSADERYPIVRSSDDYELVTGKRARVGLRLFTVLRPDRLKFDWVANGIPYPGSRHAATAAGPDEALTLAVKGTDRELCSDLTVSVLDSRGEKLPVYPDMEIEMRFPIAVYDDETVSGEVHYTARLPFGARLFYTLRTPEETLSGPHFFAASGLPGAGRFDGGDSFVRNVRLNGATLAGKEITSSLGFIGRTAAHRRVRFVRAGALTVQDVVRGVFADEYTVIVLRRPTLEMLRSWELPRRAANRLLPTERMVLLSASRERAARLRKAVELAGKEFVFAELSGGLLRSYATLIEATKPAEQRTLTVLEVPSASSRGPLPDWENLRLLSAALERLCANGTPEVLVSPGMGPDGSDADFVRELRRLARSYGVRLLEGGEAVREKSIFAELDLPKPENEPILPDIGNR